jgi:hypothetical protein
MCYDDCCLFLGGCWVGWVLVRLIVLLLGLSGAMPITARGGYRRRSLRRQDCGRRRQQKLRESLKTIWRCALKLWKNPTSGSAICLGAQLLSERIILGWCQFLGVSVMRSRRQRGGGEQECRSVEASWSTANNAKAVAHLLRHGRR